MEDVLEYMEELEKENKKLFDYMQKYGPLASFVIELITSNKFHYYEDKRKAKKKLLKENKVSNHALNSIINFKHNNPKYLDFVKISKCFGGELFISPNKEFCFEVPYDLRDQLSKLANKKNITVSKLINILLREVLEKNEK